MATFLNLYNHDLLKIAVLENAHNIVETEKINTIGTLSFDLPINDPKTALIEPYMFVRYGEDGELYRVLTPRKKRGVTGIHGYECEHVLATLIDDVIFGFKQYGGAGIHTREVINYILGLQSIKRWVLEVCEPNSCYEYAWDSETLLSMLFSVSNFFVNPIMWQCNTKVYPWRISLKWIRTDINPQLYIRAGKNMLASELEADYTNICTRLYMYGYGEGVNQLTVEGVNGGKPYIEGAKKYGNAPISRILIDRRFENPYSLLEYGQKMLAHLQEPHLQMTVDAADLYGLTGADYDKAELGRIVRLTEDETKTYIVGITRNRDKPGDMQLTLANKPYDIASSVADLADRQRIESVYAQGATQIYAQSIQANATPDKGAVINFYIPQDMRIINWVMAKIKLNKFRTYANTTKDGNINLKSTEAGGGIVKTDNVETWESGKWENTTEAGGGTITTNPLYEVYTDKENKKLIQNDSTEAGGGTVNTDPLYSNDGGGISKIQNKSTESGGGTLNTNVNAGGASSPTSGGMGGAFKTSTGSGGSIDTSLSVAQQALASSKGLSNYSFGYNGGQNVTTSAVDGSKGAHAHSFMMPGHSHGNVDLSHAHDITLPSHSHSVKVDAHSHTIDISNHTHSVTVPEHGHTVNLPAHTHQITLADHKHKIELKDHKHKITLAEHKHKIQLKDHKHKVNIPNHKHPITLNDHKHDINIPAHKHNLEHGIFEFGNPTGAQIYVNGVYKANIARDAELDISQFLLGADNKIPRGSWLSVAVSPNDFAYITIDLIIKGFCQSRGDNTY